MPIAAVCAFNVVFIGAFHPVVLHTTYIAEVEFRCAFIGGVGESKTPETLLYVGEFLMLDIVSMYLAMEHGKSI